MPYLFYQYHPSRARRLRVRRIIEVVRKAKWPHRHKSDAAIEAGCRFLRRYDRIQRIPKSQVIRRLPGSVLRTRLAHSDHACDEVRDRSKDLGRADG